MNGYACNAPGNELKNKYEGKMSSNPMLIFHVCN